MRMNLKFLILFLCITLVFVTFSVWIRCGGEITPFPKAYKGETIISKAQGLALTENSGLEEIDCHINGEYTVSCRREADEVYIPFSFIHKYFEVYGKLAKYDDTERFEWSHSYSKVYYPKGKYDPKGVFLYFENYNVELRERVKCISGTEGVPISTQWEVQGYFYPTQIAQFGLSHYSKNLTEPEPRFKIIEDGSTHYSNWSGMVVRENGIVEYSSQAGGIITLNLDHVLDFIMSVDLQLSYRDNSSLVVVLQNREKFETWILHYSCQAPTIFSLDAEVYYKINCDEGQWTHLTRDLLVDLQKGLSIQNKPKKKFSRSKYKVTKIILEGRGKLDNLTLATSRHLDQFYAAANWLVRHQDPGTGGWLNIVRRRWGPPGMKDLLPGWLSAMGQGHGMSVLARAYHTSRDPIYLKAGLEALRPFHTPSEKGGVLAKFFGGYPWYEEYPTQPSSFVLNGFIYSLIGIYDLLTLAPKENRNEAKVLFEQGMESLRKLLPLYDSGSGSFYDLRHLSLGSAPNVARWDYHATHVNQLLLLATIDNSTIISSTASRWIRYMSGKRAPHN